MAQIEQLQKERDILIEQVKAGTKDKAELVEKIKQKDQQIATLLEQTATDGTRPPPEPPNLGTMPTVAVNRPPPKDVGKIAADTFRAAASHFSGCFGEWSDRHPKTDAQLTVSLRISPNGINHDVQTRGIDDASLPQCVSDAVRAIEVPASNHVLDIEIAISYVGGVITLDPHVLGAEVAEPPIDLDRMGRPQSQLIDR